MTLPEVVRIVVLIVVFPVFFEVLEVLVTVVPLVSLLTVDRLEPVLPDRKIVLVATSTPHVVDASCFFAPRPYVSVRVVYIGNSLLHVPHRIKNVCI